MMFKQDEELDYWIKTYKPIANTFDDNASWQNEAGVGIMFETYGDELGFVLCVADNQPNHVWTLMDGDEGDPVVVHGYYIVNRIGYFITEKPWELA